MMNSPFLRDEVLALASRNEFVDAPNARSRIERLFRLVFARTPTQQELNDGLTFLADEASRETSGTASFGMDSGPRFTAWERYVHVVLLSNEFIYLD